MSRSGNPKKPHITIGNGFDVVSVPVRQSLECKKNLHPICVADIRHWHGLDRLLRGLAIYDGVPKIILHIAGNGVDLPHLQQLTSDLGITDRVIFHDFTTGIDLDNLFNISHIAVGSLGIHRIGLTESSRLKVREYCACGLPWIIGCNDPDFPDDFPYIHRIAADESPVNIEDEIEFTKAMYADHDHSQKMREHALEHLD